VKRTHETKAGRARRDRRRVPSLRVARDAEDVFRAAIRAGLLSDDPSNSRWAGHYMYMFHDENGAAWFKHRDTRAYLTLSARREASVNRQVAGQGAAEYGT